MIGRRLITDNSLSVLYFASVFVLLAHRIHLMLKIKFCILVKTLIFVVKKKDGSPYNVLILVLFYTKK